MTQGLQAAYTAHYNNEGHCLQHRYPLVHPRFKTSFVLSAGVIDMQERLAGGHDGPTRRLLIQPCFRQFDAQRLETGIHLSLFLMGAALYFDSPPRPHVVDTMLRFLTAQLHPSTKQLWLTTFGGDTVDGQRFPPDDESRKAWVELGLSPSNIVTNGADKNFWREGASSGTERSGLCGPHAEVFYDRGHSTSCASRACLPGCSCGRFLEIANAVFPEFRMSQSGVQAIPAMIAEAAAGLDRLAMITEGAASLFSTSFLSGFVTDVAHRPLTQIEDPRLIRTVTDHVRSFCCLVSEGALPGRSGRGQILRRLLKGSWLALEPRFRDPGVAITQAAMILRDHPEATPGIDVGSQWSRVSETLRAELAFIRSQREKRERT